MTTATANVLDMNTNLSAEATAATAGNQDATKRMTTWGAVWRIGGILMIHAALVAAVVFGLQFGVAYIVALELSANATIALKLLIAAVGILITAYSSLKATTAITGILRARIATKAEAASAS